MKVILLLDIAKLGKRGEVKEVADGYAINVLIAQKKAILATPSELAKWKQADDKKKREKDKSEQAFYDLIEALKQAKVEIFIKKHDNGHLFAAIPVSDIVDAIFEATKVSVNGSQIELKTPLKMLGEHIISIKQGEKKADVRIHVVAK